VPTTILCVDDEPILLQLRAIVLRQAGFEPLLAQDATEALKIFRSQHIDLVITDHLLPDCDGSQLAAQMKQINPEIPIMMLSGLSEPPEGLQHIDAYVVKGAPVPKLLERVKGMLVRST
jgi:two-component system copper resistance phosphate regulon response regulator CusR